MKRAWAFVVAILFVLISLVFSSEDAKAIPSFARQQGVSCNTCHYAFPKLNIFGMKFKYRGYRTAEGQGQNVWEWKTVPVSFGIKIEAAHNGGDFAQDKTDLLTEEIEVMAAGPIAEHFSVFGALMYMPDEDTWDSIGRVRIDDIISHGRLNIEAGNIELEFPFLAISRRLVRQSYLTQKIGFLERKEALEANGIVETEGQVHTYFYNVGVARDKEVDSGNKLASYYATLTVGVAQHLIGLHYRWASEDQDTSQEPTSTNPTLRTDEDVQRYGITGEFNVGPLTVVPGYFNASYNNYALGGNDLDADDYLLEVFFRPAEKVVVGLRGEQLQLDGGPNNTDGDITDVSINVSYYFLPNIFFAVEYRNREYSDVEHDTIKPASGENFTEQKGRAFLIALF